MGVAQATNPTELVIGECLAGKKGCFGLVRLVTGCESVFHLNRVKEAIMVGIIIKLQHHHHIGRLTRVTHLVQVTVITKTGCILSRHARIRKILLMWSLVRYKYFT